MFGFGSRRSRVARVISVRARESVWSRWWERLKQRGTLLRCVMVLIALVAMSIALQSWRTVFQYRLGDTEVDGIAAKIKFERVDREETERAKNKATERVPYFFQNQPQQLAKLPQALKSALGAVAQADSLDALKPEIQRAFGLQPAKSKDGTARAAEALFGTDVPDKRFEDLKQTLLPSNKLPNLRPIDDIVDDFTKFISPLSRYGVIDEDVVRRLHIRGDRLIRAIRPEGDTDKRPLEDVPLAKVQLVDQLNEAGDLGKAWLSYPALKAPIQPAISYWLMVEVQPTLIYEQSLTRDAEDAARDAVKPVMNKIIVGDLIVPPGESIDAARYEILADEYRECENQMTFFARWKRAAVVFVLLSVLAGLNGYYIVHNEPRIVSRIGRLTVYLAAIVLTAGLARALSYSSWRIEVTPLLVTVMVLAIAYNQVLATLTAFSLCLVLTLSTSMQLEHFVILICSCTAAVIPLSGVGSRLSLINASVIAAIACFLVSCGVEIISAPISSHEIARAVLSRALNAAFWCLAAGFITTGALPLIESLFGVVTDLTLLELSDPSHPLLQELVRRAPGTYNHSIAVASIAEAAAESIGANGLLVRVGAYFHDLGKMLKPQYFIENVQAGSESRHEHLAPAMSTLVIIGHVKDGVDLAEQHDLPRAMIDFIEQHHGTTLVEYFFHEAAKLAEHDPDHRTDAEEATFRYPGPKPQTKEAGVLMLSDAVEGASRTLTDPTPRRIETLVHSLTMKRLLDGQFDECAITLSELRTIETSLVKSLIGIYHGRIRYPEVRSAG